jgi:cell shape-determining protein MreD
VLLAVVSLQTAFFGYVRPFGVMPNLLLVVVLMQGLFGSASGAVAMGIGGGLLLDIASGSDFGLRTAFYASLTLAVIVIRQLGLHLDALWVTALVAIVATIGFDIAILFTIGFANLGGQFGIIFGKILIESAENMLLALLAQLIIMSVGSSSKTDISKRVSWL